MAGHTQVVVFEVLGSCSIDMVAVTLGAEILVGYMQFFDIGHNDRLSDCRLVGFLNPNSVGDTHEYLG